MTDRNRIKNQLRRRRSARVSRHRRQQRRGVLLLVVLSMLVLFMLVGTTFMLTSKHNLSSSKAQATLKQFDNKPGDLLERALKQVLRDTQNANSAVRYHSLLRDMYGADGFHAQAWSDANLPALLPQYAATALFNLNIQTDLGPASGQLIDIYMSESPPVAGVAPTVAQVLKLETDLNGQPQDHVMPFTDGYYNGALLTVLSGAASGQTTRIVSFTYINDNPEIMSALNNPSILPTWCIRVMSFARADGTPLVMPFDLTGAQFMVNGRPFNGTGVGYNPLAQVGGARLSAYDAMQLPSGEWIGTEYALTPNAVHFLPANATYLDPAVAVALNPPLPPSPFDGQPNGAFKPLNAVALSYPSYAGLGDTDESYDAADFQNMYLALLSTMPRARGRVMDTTGAIGAAGLVYDVDDPAVQQLLSQFGTVPTQPPYTFTPLYKPIIDDVPLPSFHRPDLAHYWFIRLFTAPWLVSAIADPQLRTQAILQPYDPATGVARGSAQIAAQITAIKRKMMLRPLPEDHPNFDGSNPMSRYAANSPLVPWEVVGPWDVDNDNDGVPDSIWIDLGDPIQETADGKLYKPLYAFLIVDLDSKLNLNAHGSSEHLVNAELDNVYDQVRRAGYTGVNLFGNLAGRGTSNNLVTGNAWGTADISLRPIFPYPVDNSGTQLLPANINPLTDDYARLFFGRPLVGSLDRVTFGRHGGYELMNTANAALGLVTGMGDVHPGKSYKANTPNSALTRDPHTSYDHSGYPVFDTMWVNRVMSDGWPGIGAQATLESYLLSSGAASIVNTPNGPIRIATPNSFGTAPDLRARTALALSYTGQPVYESTWEWNPLSPWGNNTLPLWPLVDDSPYELDLYDEFRNDHVADSYAMQQSSVAGAPINDDAPFAVAELERILRAFDADTGILPDRLWNLVDAFDPIKLSATPRYLVAFPNAADAPARLAQAQIDASINRRLVTSESWDSPAPAGNMYTRLLLGADGKPGKAGVDDNNNSIIDDALEIGWCDNDFNVFLIDPSVPGSDSDDFGSVMRHLKDFNGVYLTAVTALPPDGAGLVDYLRYRVILELFRKGAINNSNNTNTVVIADNLANPIITQLMPPDILAGLKMDLNRPFGDGKDNRDSNGNLNGVVDEPQEAGEPFVDLNDPNMVPNRWIAGEPYLDLNNNGRYDGPLDTLWHNDIDGDGALDPNEFAAEFDHLHGAVKIPLDLNADGDTIDPQDGVFIPGGDYARQLYARHLYVLALLTMDENYVAPYDEDNAQIRKWIDKVKKDLLDDTRDTTLNAEAARQGVAREVWAEHIARKKLTFREVAQWAINCVEMRDSDVIMTPFEYDENPWDGWNVYHIDASQSPTRTIIVPLDGDVATDENLGQFVDWPMTLNNSNQRQVTAYVNADIPTFAEQTRAVAWGAERPELLITENLALHDRRTENLQSVNTKGHNLLNTEPNADKWRDEDLDQRLRPQGSLFVEVYNPWSDDGQKPAELYSLHPRNNAGAITGNAVPSPGVELGRVSDLFVRQNNEDKRSPIWRLIVVEEDPIYRNTDPLDDERFDGAAKAGVPRPTSTVFRYTDPDFFGGFDYLAMPKPTLRATVVTGQYEFENQKRVDWQYTRTRFELPYPYVEREFYFTTNHSPPLNRTLAGFSRTSSRYNVEDTNFRLRVPPRSIEYRVVGGSGRNSTVIAQTQKFIHPDAEDPSNPARQIAPVMPGSYGVIGSAGTRYVGNYTTTLNESFTTTIGRLAREDERMPISNTGPMQPALRRRIELQVGRDTLGLLRNRVPSAQQVFVVNNGGKMTPNLRDNELFGVLPVPQASPTNPPVAAADIFFAPAVGIPVEGMSISEPCWEYQAREIELTEKETAGLGTAGGSALKFNPNLIKGEGSYARGAGNPPPNADSIDTPFDDAPELVRTGTIPNYRMIHLQRLANPLLPWNPAPGEYTWVDQSSQQQDAHVPSLPINPYRTIDSSSADLTAYNGVSGAEADQNDTFQADKQQYRPWTNDGVEVGRFVRSLKVRGGQQIGQYFRFRSNERGTTAALAMLKDPAGPTSLPTRAIWQQEPAKPQLTPYQGTPNAFEDFLDIYPWVDPTSPEAQKRMTSHWTMRGQDARNAGFNDQGNTMQMDMVLEHSLGFGNEAVGLLYDKNNPPAVIVNGMATTYTVALGAPAREAIPNTALIMESTYPWLAWNNRPYSSDMELLQVPAKSSSEMLRKYSVTNRHRTVDPANPYDGNIPAPMTTPTPAQINDWRDINHHGHFGHLMNFFEAANAPADILRDNTGAPVLDSTTADIKLIPVGSPHYYRLLDYLYVPSKFVGADTMLNPVAFNRSGLDHNIATDDVLNPLDPRQSLLAPFNRVAKYREPGRVNLNTVSDARVWDGGVLHRTAVAGVHAPNSGHLGIPYVGYPIAFPTGANTSQIAIVPGLVDVRRGYGTGGNSQYLLDPTMPTLFANPFRSGDAGDLVPLPNMVQQGGVHATKLRGVTLPNYSGGTTTEVAFAEHSLRRDFPEFDVSRNPYLKYAALNRTGSAGTTRSNVFAVWVTVGFFEVEPAPAWLTPVGAANTVVQNRFNGNRALYDRVYPDGYALAQEIGADTGDTKRHRAFYIIDRTLPVGFKPGEDVNVENIIKLRRRIE